MNTPSQSSPAILTTSLAEIYSYGPCASGWKAVLRGQNKMAPDDIQFPLVDCVESNSISDVCWLLGKRKAEIQICVRFARMCADSVAHLKNSRAEAAIYAADAADAIYAIYAADAADAADAAAIYAADAAVYDDAVYETQKQKNKQFLIQCINEFSR